MSQAKKRQISDLSPQERRALLAKLLEQKAAAPKVYPLALAQQRLWFFDRLVPGSSLYNIPVGMRMTGPLNVSALERGLTQIVGRHEALRTTFEQRDDGPVQIAAPSGVLPLPVFDLKDLPGERREAEALRLANVEARRPFDLEAGPLIRARLLRIEPEDHILVLVMHHIVSEAWSIALLFKELEAFYRANTTGQAPSLPKPALPFGDFARWQHERLRDGVQRDELAYWCEVLSGELPTLQLPVDRPRPPVQSVKGAWCATELPVELSAALKRFSREEGVTLFMTLLAAYQLLLYRYSGQADILVGSPIAGRNRPEAEGMIGFFVNTVVLRTDLSGEPTFRQLLRRVRDVCLGAFGHQDLPFERLVEELRPERSLSHSPVFQVMFALQNTPRPALDLPGMKACRHLGPDVIHNGGAKVDLTLIAEERGEALVSSFEYCRDLFEESTIRRMLGHWKTLLEGIVADPSRSIAELPILTPAERHQLLVEWNDTDTDGPRDRCVQQLFEERAERSPEAVAVAHLDESLSYGELNRRANRLAHHLAARGIGRGQVAALCTTRSSRLLIGALGALKSGAAYLPLDPDYPPERLAFMIEDAGAAVVLTEEQLLGVLPSDGASTLCLDRDWATIAREPDGNPPAGAAPDDLAYVIYTSGSTGRPKGVAIPHAGLLNLVHWHRRTFAITAADRATQLAGTAFDASVWEIWPYLTAGASLHLVPPPVAADPEALRDWLVAQGISVTFLPTPLAERVLPLDWPDASSLRYVLTGGDKLHDYPSARLPFEVINNYGPTESTVVTTSTPVTDAARTAVAPPIGRPIDNTRVYVVDRALEPVPIGVVGELLVGGASLARGYVNRPELTRQLFIDSPFGDRRAPRLYKTGDLARYLPDGNLEFIGRSDLQVKVRGFRIELGEIEAALARLEPVREAVVVARDDHSGAARLVAYVVPRSNDAPSTTELRRALSASLPEFMIPAAFVLLGELPLTANGKVDRRALPAPEADRPELEQAFVPPRDNVELQLTHIWEQALERRPIGVRDDFFELGGHSLVAVQIFAQIERRFGKKIPLDILFQTPTIEQLAAALSSDEPELPPTPLVTVQPCGSRPPFFCVPPAASPGIVFAPLGRHLGDEQPLYGLTPLPLGGRKPTAAWYEETAAAYLREIKALQPNGPYHLGGSCYGGFLAFELARQLIERGDEVRLLALIDVGYPLRHDPAYVVRRAVATTIAGAINLLKSGEPYEYVVIPKQRIRFDLLRRSQRPQATYVQEVWDANLRAAGEYQVRRYPGRVTLIQSVELDADQGIREAWGRLCAGGVDYHRVDVPHVELLRDPWVERLASVLGACLEAARATHQPVSG